MFRARQSKSTNGAVIRLRVKEQLRGEKDRQLRSATVVLRTVHSRFFQRAQLVSTTVSKLLQRPPGAVSKSLSTTGASQTTQKPGAEATVLALVSHETTSTIMAHYHRSILRGCSVGFRKFLPHGQESHFATMVGYMNDAFLF